MASSYLQIHSVGCPLPQVESKTIFYMQIFVYLDRRAFRKLFWAWVALTGHILSSLPRALLIFHLHPPFCIFRWLVCPWRHMNLCLLNRSCLSFLVITSALFMIEEIISLTFQSTTQPTLEGCVTLFTGLPTLCSSLYNSVDEIIIFITCPSTQPCR